MPLVRGGRPLKRWRYLGLYGLELMLCAGDARVGVVPRRWWAVAPPDGSLHERTTTGRGGLRLDERRLSVRARDVSIELEVGNGGSGAVEVVSPHGESYIWTRKRLVPVRGGVTIGTRAWSVEGDALLDESAGYHARHTTWRWSAGTGRAEGGERVAWNLVAGVHDASEASERTVWVDGEPQEVGPVEFAEDLSRVAGLEFDEWCARVDRTRLGPFRSDYRQPFGSFSGELPNGLRLAEGYGVMESHDVRW
jgi:hypothetical protein